MIRGISEYFLIGSFAVLAAATVTFAGLALEVNAQPIAERGDHVQHVDRTDKSDRLDLHRNIGTQPKKDEAAPTGCDTVFGPLSSRGSNPAGRCVA